MRNDCVYDAWCANLHDLGIKTSLSDRMQFWYWRYRLDGTLPGQPTKIKHVLDIICGLNFQVTPFQPFPTNKYEVIVNRVQMEVYDASDLSIESRRFYAIEQGITVTSGIFLSLVGKHAYYTTNYAGYDWPCMAIQLKKY